MKYPIPLEAMNNHIGVLGKTGSGKTYAVKGMMELLMDQNRRCCAIDPTGVYFGLKSKYKIPVFGGPHADIQLGAAHGEAIAEIVATSETSIIIDTSEMRVGERTRFFKDFAETLLRKNKTELNLIIDEAHLFAPQGKVNDPISGAMLHATNNLVSLGRSKGLRITLISQRPAKLHKDSLSQVETLVAMRLVSPQDRAAVKEWVVDQGDNIQGQAQKIIAELPNLKTGEGWLWVPGLHILEKVKFPKIKTFDSGAASLGTEAKLLPIDLEKIQSKLATIGDEIIKNDPATLKKRLAALEKQLKDQKDPWAAEKVDELQKGAYSDGYSAGRTDGYEFGYRQGKRDARAEVISWINSAPQEDSIPKDAMPRITKISDKVKELSKAPRAIVIYKDPDVIYMDDKPLKQPSDLSGPEEKILNSLRFWKTIGYETPSKDQVAAVAGYSPSGGAFQNPMGKLRSKGLVEYPSHGIVKLTADNGASYMTTDEAKEKMLSVLGGPEKKIMAAFEGTEKTLTRAVVAEKSGYNPVGGAFQNPVGRLCTLGILEKPSHGVLKLSDWAEELFA